eukprot:g1049.t1
MPEKTIRFRYQLIADADVIAIAFNTRRNQILLADRSRLNLWSLRKRIAYANLPKRSDVANKVPTGPEPKPTKVLEKKSNDSEPDNNALVSSIIYNETIDKYFVAYGRKYTIRREENEETGLLEYNWKEAKDSQQPCDFGMIYVYHASLTVLIRLRAHQSHIFSMFVHTRRSLLITCGSNESADKATQQVHGELRLWNLKTSPDDGKLNIKLGKKLGGDKGYQPLTVLTGQGASDRVFCGNADGDLMMVDLNTMQWSGVWRKIHESRITCLHYLTASDEIIIGFADGYFGLWVVGNTAEYPKITLLVHAYHQCPVQSLMLDESTENVVTCSDEGTLTHWCRRDGYKQDEKPFKANKKIVKHKHFSSTNPPTCAVIFGIRLPGLVQKEAVVHCFTGMITFLDILSPFEAIRGIPGGIYSLQRLEKYFLMQRKETSGHFLVVDAKSLVPVETLTPLGSNLNSDMKYNCTSWCVSDTGDLLLGLSNGLLLFRDKLNQIADTPISAISVIGKFIIAGTIEGGLYICHRNRKIEDNNSKKKKKSEGSSGRSLVLVKVIKSHSSAIRNILSVKGKKYIISIEARGTVRIWSLPDFIALGCLNVNASCPPSLQSKHLCHGLLLPSPEEIVLALGNGTLQYWDLQYKSPMDITMKPNRVLTAHVRSITSLQLDTMSVSESSSTCRFLSSSLDEVVIIWLAMQGGNQPGQQNKIIPLRKLSLDGPVACAHFYNKRGDIVAMSPAKAVYLPFVGKHTQIVDSEMPSKQQPEQREVNKIKTGKRGKPVRVIGSQQKKANRQQQNSIDTKTLEHPQHQRLPSRGTFSVNDVRQWTAPRSRNRESRKTSQEKKERERWSATVERRPESHDSEGGMSDWARNDLAMDMLLPGQVAVLRDAFARADVDNRGTISFDVLGAILAALPLSGESIRPKSNEKKKRSKQAERDISRREITATDKQAIDLLTKQLKREKRDMTNISFGTILGFAAIFVKLRKSLRKQSLKEQKKSYQKILGKTLIKYDINGEKRHVHRVTTVSEPEGFWRFRHGVAKRIQVKRSQELRENAKSQQDARAAAGWINSSIYVHDSDFAYSSIKPKVPDIYKRLHKNATFHEASETRVRTLEMLNCFGLEEEDTLEEAPSQKQTRDTGTRKKTKIIRIASLLAQINEIFESKKASDVTDDRVGRERSSMPFFLYNWLTMKFGVAEVIVEKMIELFNGILHYHSIPLVRVFGRFIGLLSAPLTSQDFIEVWKFINEGRQHGNKAEGHFSDLNSRKLDGLESQCLSLYFDLGDFVKKREKYFKGFTSVPLQKCLSTIITREKVDIPCIQLSRVFEIVQDIVPIYIPKSIVGVEMFPDDVHFAIQEVSDIMMSRLYALPSANGLSEELYNKKGPQGPAKGQKDIKDPETHFVELHMAIEVIIEEFRAWNVYNGLHGLMSTRSGAPTPIIKKNVQIPNSPIFDPSRKFSNFKLLDIATLNDLLDQFIALDKERTNMISLKSFEDILHDHPLFRDNEDEFILEDRLINEILKQFAFADDDDFILYLNFWSRLYANLSNTLDHGFSQNVLLNTLYVITDGTIHQSGSESGRGAPDSIGSRGIDTDDTFSESSTNRERYTEEGSNYEDNDEQEGTTISDNRGYSAHSRETFATASPPFMVDPTPIVDRKNLPQPKMFNKAIALVNGDVPADDADVHSSHLNLYEGTFNIEKTHIVKTKNTLGISNGNRTAWDSIASTKVATEEEAEEKAASLFVKSSHVPRRHQKTSHVPPSTLPDHGWKLPKITPAPKTKKHLHLSDDNNGEYGYHPQQRPVYSPDAGMEDILKLSKKMAVLISMDNLFVDEMLRSQSQYSSKVNSINGSLIENRSSVLNDNSSAFLRHEDEMEGNVYKQDVVVHGRDDDGDESPVLQKVFDAPLNTKHNNTSFGFPSSEHSQQPSFGIEMQKSVSLPNLTKQQRSNRYHRQQKQKQDRQREHNNSNRNQKGGTKTSENLNKQKKKFGHKQVTKLFRSLSQQSLKSSKEGSLPSVLRNEEHRDVEHITKLSMVPKIINLSGPSEANVNTNVNDEYYRYADEDTNFPGPRKPSYYSDVTSDYADSVSSMATSSYNPNVIEINPMVVDETNRVDGEEKNPSVPSGGDPFDFEEEAKHSYAGIEREEEKKATTNHALDEKSIDEHEPSLDNTAVINDDNESTEEIEKEDKEEEASPDIPEDKSMAVGTDLPGEEATLECESATKLLKQDNVVVKEDEEFKDPGKPLPSRKTESKLKSKLRFGALMRNALKTGELEKAVEKMETELENENTVVNTKEDSEDAEQQSENEAESKLIASSNALVTMKSNEVPINVDPSSSPTKTPKKWKSKLRFGALMRNALQTGELEKAVEKMESDLQNVEKEEESVDQLEIEARTSQVMMEQQRDEKEDDEGKISIQSTLSEAHPQMKALPQPESLKSQNTTDDEKSLTTSQDDVMPLKTKVVQKEEEENQYIDTSEHDLSKSASLPLKETKKKKGNLMKKVKFGALMRESLRSGKLEQAVEKMELDLNQQETQSEENDIEDEKRTSVPEEEVPQVKTQMPDEEEKAKVVKVEETVSTMDKEKRAIPLATEVEPLIEPLVEPLEPTSMEQLVTEEKTDNDNHASVNKAPLDKESTGSKLKKKFKFGAMMRKALKTGELEKAVEEMENNLEQNDHDQGLVQDVNLLGSPEEANTATTESIVPAPIDNDEDLINEAVTILDSDKFDDSNSPVEMKNVDTKVNITDTRVDDESDKDEGKPKEKQAKEKSTMQLKKKFKFGALMRGALKSGELEKAVEKMEEDLDNAQEKEELPNAEITNTNDFIMEEEEEKGEVEKNAQDSISSNFLEERKEIIDDKGKLDRSELVSEKDEDPKPQLEPKPEDIIKKATTETDPITSLSENDVKEVEDPENLLLQKNTEEENVSAKKTIVSCEDEKVVDNDPENDAELGNQSIETKGPATEEMEDENNEMKKQEKIVIPNLQNISRDNSDSVLTNENETEEESPTYDKATVEEEGDEEDDDGSEVPPLCTIEAYSAMDATAKFDNMFLEEQETNATITTSIQLVQETLADVNNVVSEPLENFDGKMDKEMISSGGDEKETKTNLALTTTENTDYRHSSLHGEQNQSVELGDSEIEEYINADNVPFHPDAAASILKYELQNLSENEIEEINNAATKDIIRVNYRMKDQGKERVIMELESETKAAKSQKKSDEARKFLTMISAARKFKAKKQKAIREEKISKMEKVQSLPVRILHDEDIDDAEEDIPVKKPEFELHFSQNISFKPFELMKQHDLSLPQWNPEEADGDESDGPDTDDELQEEKREKERRRMTELASFRLIVEGTADQQHSPSPPSSSVASSSPGTLVETQSLSPTSTKMYDGSSPTSSNPALSPSVMRVANVNAEIHVEKERDWKGFFRTIENDIFKDETVKVESELEKEARILKERKRAMKRQQRREKALDRLNLLKKVVKTNTYRDIIEKRMNEMEDYRMTIHDLRPSKKLEGSIDPMLMSGTRSKTATDDSVSDGRKTTEALQKEEDEIYIYYTFYVSEEQNRCLFSINLTAVEGDPDIFVRTDALPSKFRSTWSSTSIGNGRIIIHPDDPQFKTEANYIVAVYSKIYSVYNIELEVMDARANPKSNTILHTEHLLHKFNMIEQGQTKDDGEDKAITTTTQEEKEQANGSEMKERDESQDDSGTVRSNTDVDGEENVGTVTTALEEIAAPVITETEEDVERNLLNQLNTNNEDVDVSLADLQSRQLEVVENKIRDREYVPLVSNWGMKALLDKKKVTNDNVCAVDNESINHDDNKEEEDCDRGEDKEQEAGEDNQSDGQHETNLSESNRDALFKCLKTADLHSVKIEATPELYATASSLVENGKMRLWRTRTSNSTISSPIHSPIRVRKKQQRQISEPSKSNSSSSSLDKSINKPLEIKEEMKRRFLAKLERRIQQRRKKAIASSPALPKYKMVRLENSSKKRHTKR